MGIKKFLRIAACALAIPAGASSLGGCTTQEEAFLLSFGGMLGFILVMVLTHHSNNGTESPNSSQSQQSDARLKTDIKPVALLPNGLMLYSYKFRSDPTTTYVGLLAQDLLRSGNEMYRNAVVVDANGYYAVKYGELGLRMFTLDEWKDISTEVCRHPESQCHYIRMSDIHITGTGHLAFAN
jgi:Chaperone of endosialidase